MKQSRQTKAAIATLHRQGYTVTAPTAWVRWRRQREVAKELGMPEKAIAQRLRHPLCPPYEFRRSEGGSITGILLTPDVRTFLSQPLAPGRRGLMGRF